MSTTLVPLALIDDSPFQARSHYDAEAVEALAESIRASGGLLSPPVARLVDPDGAPVQVVTGLVHLHHPPRVYDLDDAVDLRALFEEREGYRIQLAVGHTRLRAYRLLDERDRAAGLLPEPSRWAAMPVDLRALDDDAMERAAWDENAHRADLDPVDRAAAIAARVERHGWTHEEAGAHLGLSRSAVSNILRWYQAFRYHAGDGSTPDRVGVAALAAVRDGRLSEAKARALATAFIAAQDWPTHDGLVADDELEDLDALLAEAIAAADADGVRVLATGYAARIEAEAARHEAERKRREEPELFAAGGERADVAHVAGGAMDGQPRWVAGWLAGFGTPIYIERRGGHWHNGPDVARATRFTSLATAVAALRSFRSLGLSDRVWMEVAGGQWEEAWRYAGRDEPGHAEAPGAELAAYVEALDAGQEGEAGPSTVPALEAPEPHILYDEAGVIWGFGPGLAGADADAAIHIGAAERDGVDGPTGGLDAAPCSPELAERVEALGAAALWHLGEDGMARLGPAPSSTPHGSHGGVYNWPVPTIRVDAETASAWARVCAASALTAPRSPDGTPLPGIAEHGARRYAVVGVAYNARRDREEHGAPEVDWLHLEELVAPALFETAEPAADLAADRRPGTGAGWGRLVRYRGVTYRTAAAVRAEVVPAEAYRFDAAAFARPAATADEPAWAWPAPALPAAYAELEGMTKAQLEAAYARHACRLTRAGHGDFYRNAKKADMLGQVRATMEAAAGLAAAMALPDEEVDAVVAHVEAGTKRREVAGDRRGTFLLVDVAAEGLSRDARQKAESAEKVVWAASLIGEAERTFRRAATRALLASCYEEVGRALGRRPPADGRPSVLAPREAGVSAETPAPAGEGRAEPVAEAEVAP